MTLADQVKTCIETRCPGTFSLYAGYGIENGKQVRFAGGVQQKERRNDKGRVTFSQYIYADGSILEFKYSENSGYKLIVK